MIEAWYDQLRRSDCRTEEKDCSLLSHHEVWLAVSDARYASGFRPGPGDRAQRLPPHLPRPDCLLLQLTSMHYLLATMFADSNDTRDARSVFLVTYGLGSFAGPFVVGTVYDEFHTFEIPFYMIGASAFIAACLLSIPAQLQLKKTGHTSDWCQKF